jgi:uncharacterized protein YcbK (DUF882 family)
MNRRTILKAAGSAVCNGALIGGGALAALAPASATPHPVEPARAVAGSARWLSFFNTHTGESFAGVYWESGRHVPDAMMAINRVMRDHRSGEEHDIDPRLLDQLHTLHDTLDARSPFQIISGYRSPASNAAMAANSTGVATRSLHMDGRAIDIRVRGVELTRLRDAALAMNAGGVGYYASSDFIHIDTGRVRRW